MQKTPDQENAAPRYCAVYKYATISAQKARLFADLVRGKQAYEALELLACYPNRSARMLEKTIKSAIANAEDLDADNLDDLYIVEVRVDGGPMQRRWKPGSRGVSYVFKRRSSHISVVLE